ncbi:hypothetical protein GY45DRAFT_684470 [Cubamyces sp. BRFM 1775]|nr:hypothetical protein GY45DRAFT_684470 [Cubamyces sp. BRFM 1775]
MVRYPLIVARTSCTDWPTARRNGRGVELKRSLESRGFICLLAICPLWVRSTAGHSMEQARRCMTYTEDQHASPDAGPHDRLVHSEGMSDSSVTKNLRITHPQEVA